MTSKAKKRVVLPVRPEPPSTEQILEDVQRAQPSDPVFILLAEPSEDLPTPAKNEDPEAKRERLYRLTQSYVEMNQRLQAACSLLKEKCEELKLTGATLEQGIMEMKQKALREVIKRSTAGLSDMTSAPFRYDFSLWYCLDDDDIATSISTTLRAHGFRGYVEHQDAAAGQPVVASANETIEASRVAIVLLTARSVADPWCQRVVEWNVIRTIHQEGTKVVPIYEGLTSTEVPVALRHLTGLEYSSRFFKQRLIGSLQRARRARGHPVPSEPGGRLTDL